MGGERPPFTTDPDALEDAARERAGARAVLVRRRLGRLGCDRARQPGGVRRLAHRAAHAHRRHRARPRPRRCSARSSRRRCITAPVGVQWIMHPDAETGRRARGRANSASAWSLSTVSSFTLEEVAARRTATAPRWFQLLLAQRRGRLRQLPRAARKAAGFSALRRHARHLVARLAPARPRHTRTCRSSPARGWPTTSPIRRSCAGLAKPPPRTDPRPPSCAGCRCSPAPTTPGTNLAFLREHWDGPIVLKGIQHRRRRAPGGRRRRGGHRRVQPRRPPGRRRDRLARRAAGHRRRGRRPGRGAVRLGIRTGADIIKALGARRDGRAGRPAVGLRARPRRHGRRAARAALACSPTSTCRSRCRETTARPH